MRALDIADAFDGDDMFAIDTYEWGQAGVDGGMVDLFCGWVILRDHLQHKYINTNDLVIYQTDQQHTTVQAPQPPSAHPSLVPVRPIPLRYSSKVTSGSAVSKLTFVPLR